MLDPQNRSDSFIDRQRKLIQQRWFQISDDLETLCDSESGILTKDMKVEEIISVLRNSIPKEN